MALGDDKRTGAVDLSAWRDGLLATLRSDVGARGGAEPKSTPASQRLEVLAFGVGSETYAVAIEDVAEILLPRPVTPLPRTPGFVQGVVSLRGTVLPVVDLSKRLGLQPGDRSRACRILVLRDGEERMGFWVDRVSGVVRFSQGDIATTDFASAVDSRYLRGIGYDRKGTLIAVLRPEALCDFAVETR